ncbi:MAG: dTDP-4-dehydrorhamnose 3,5-epimerase [Chloroflexota bacterium]
MEFQPLWLEGACIIQPNVFYDDRGYFMVPYQAKAFAEHGLPTNWVQDNQSLSTRRGVLRGFHFQMPPHTEAKLVRVLDGVIMDVIVDLRKDSPTFGQWDSVELSAENQKMVYIPRGFAHAFCVVSDRALVTYKVDNDYAPKAQAGLIWNDPTLNIPWPVDDPLLSEKDSQLPTLAEFESPF